MKKPSNISHPLKNYTGTSQRTRLITALETGTAPIDGKTLADRLFLISEYAQQINFYDYKADKTTGEYQQICNWASFFKNSLPFQLAILSKTSLIDLEEQFLLLSGELKTNPSKQTLESVLVFIHHKLLDPVSTLYTAVENQENSFSVPLLAIIKSSFLEPVKNFIALYNASATFLCIDKKSFTNYMGLPWQLGVEEVYALDICIQQVKKGKKEAFLKAAELLDIIFYQMFSGFKDVVNTASDYLEESLLPLEISLQKKHEPHLALLFTFLEVFKHFQGNINELGKKHLDFFYEKVLQMAPKDAVPDKAHLVFEVAKHLDEYQLREDLLLKDSKDANKQEIQFGLDHEIILDKAQLKEVKTLALNPVQETEEDHLEGVYIAPIANSSDGIGRAFEKDQPMNWASLGSKFSKYILDENVEAVEHPKARLGFALASPVLLLQEGERTINITLVGSAEADILGKLNGLYDVRTMYGIPEDIIDTIKTLFDEDYDHAELALTAFNDLLDKQVNHKIYEEDLEEFLVTTNPETGTQIFTDALKDGIRDLFADLETTANILNTPVFTFHFSGEEEWLAPKEENTAVEIEQTPGGINFHIQMDLDKDFPAVTFFNAENLKEKLDLKKSQPVLKIELVKDLQIVCDIENLPSPCCLKNTPPKKPTIAIAPYELFKSVVLTDALIEVVVCGVKDLIVQNDESLLDINSEIFPFGLRPDVPGFDPMNQLDVDAEEEEPDPIGERKTDPMLGPSFYIGSKEILYKKWDAVRVNLEWKNKPESFHDYYKAYLKEKNIPAGTFDIEDFGLAEEDFKLKIDKLNNGNWDDLDKIELFEKTKDDFGDLYCDTTVYGWEVENSAPKEYIDYEQPLEFFKNSLDGFLKFTLADQDFLHSEYPFVLARQMLAYAYTSEDKVLTDAIYFEGSNKTIISPIKDILETFGALPDLTALIDGINESFDKITDTIGAIEDYITNELTGGAPTTAVNLLQGIEALVSTVKTLIPAPGDPLPTVGDLLTAIATLPNPSDFNDIVDKINDLLLEFEVDDAVGTPLLTFTENLKTTFNEFVQILDDSNILDILDQKALQALIPNEPWTPAIKNMYVDYSASANINEMEIIHLYPFENTSRHEDITQKPTLLPTHSDEGTLFIGFENLTPLGNLSLLFQLAEATADSEMDRAQTKWHYLSNNTWQELEPDFDVVSDATDGLTVSGIVSIAVPEDINTTGNTLMPDHLYWIKVAVEKNAKAVAETIGIHTQAAKSSARIGELNDTNRLETALEAGSIAKLVNGDFNVKKVEQPYGSFDGRKAEAEGHFYTRVSEHLKHKGRAKMGNDYEKIVLEGFPKIYKVKCITHTMGLSAHEYRRDLEIAPGFVVVAVIPDLTKLKSGNLLEPKVPVSLLEKIGDYIRKKTSPFARIRVMNPRYEYVNVTIEVRLYRGKSVNFYKQKLKDDLTGFLAPWFLGDSEKLAFGQVVLFSDVVGFVEQLDYVDFIVHLELRGECGQTGPIIKPLTARSILAGGKIRVGINEEECLPAQKCVEQKIIFELPPQ